MTLQEYVNSIKSKTIAIIGAGVSNLPLIRLLVSSGCDITVFDKRSFEDMGEISDELQNAGVKLVLGDNYLDDLDQDIIFRTPGLMPFDEHLVKAEKNGSYITSEMEVFFSLCPCKIVAVTGSDGKTTTTTIISELLKAAGFNVHLGGNIGRPLLCDLPSFTPDDIAVLELSSFQLHSMKCCPSIAVITNISPNHLDKHIDFEDYYNAKMSIFKRQQADDLLVLNICDDLSDYYAENAESRISYFGDDRIVENGVFCRNGIIYRVVDGVNTEIMHENSIRIPGRHNVQNYMAAFAATAGIVSDDICRQVAKQFGGVEHRLEEVRILRGVRYINDSIGTSPTRTIAGLNALKTKPIVIAGGYDKHIPFDVLGDAFCVSAKKLFLTGATAQLIKKAVVESEYYEDSGLEIEIIDDFKDTVIAASKYAVSGDVVLLSPACAAFDRFKNFAERGKYFKKLVMELK